MHFPGRRPLPDTPRGSTVLLLLASLTAAAQPVLTERQFVERVLASGLDARVAEGEAAFGRAEAVGVGRWPNPSLEWQRESARLEGGERETQDIVAASVPLVLSGRLGLEAESAEQGARAAEARRDQARLRLWNEATRAFAAALGAQERRAILADSLAAMKRLEVAIAAREKAGEAAGYDHLRVSIEASMVEDLLRGAVLDERKHEAEALRLLPPGSGELPPLQGPLVVDRPLPTREELLSALEARPDVRAWELEARSAELARRAAARGWIPEPTLNAGAQLLGVGQPGASTGYVVGLALPLPLFQHRQGEAARAEARRELAEAWRAALLHAARVRLAAAHDEVTGRRERLALHRSSVLERTGELRRIAEAAWRGGSADLLVLMDAERASREARLAAVELSVSAIEAEVDLLLLAGVPMDAEPRSTAR
ncbi:TolC family protein [Archangium sp.]|uniref:TolC family protein n=1 Tax=Archangium sp. TaxID=1872627 RepID=UPI002D73BB77|nr:TolC family protein [Archangium sp.]HYO59505.1 TolC family protein [Archangium sp.]